jgi:hypothetical protein
VTGSYRENGIVLPMELIAEPIVSDDGNFRIELDLAKIGPISAPDVLRDRAQELLDEAVQQAMQEQNGSQFIVSNVEIADGKITIRGRKP